MERIIESAKERAKWIKHMAKVVAVAASSGAALVSIFTALYSYGVIGQAETHQSIGNIGASWVGLRPSIDTASAIGDTVHYAATVTDKNGSILVGARPVWTTGDSSIAVVLQDGSVVARGPGRTMVSVVVGKLVTHSTVVVQQRVARVDVGRASGDSLIVLPEGSQLELRARPVDARGYAIQGLQPVWHVDDTTVATLDSVGVVTGRSAGRTSIVAKVDGVAGRTGISVVTPASAIALVAGSSQRTLAGKTLPQAVVVRATNRRGGPASGKRVVFRVVDGQGGVDPASAITDADGRARTNWTLGNDPGRQTLFASVENVDSALAIVAESDPIASNTRVTSLVDGLKGEAGEQLADSVSIRVTDSAGRVLPDVPVRWTAVDGGSVDEASGRTDSLGVATVHWTLAKKTGTQRLRAQVGLSPGLGIAPLTINAAALAGAPAQVELVSGGNQRASAGAELSKPLVFRVLDENGSGVADAVVTLSPSGGTIADTLLTTDSVGIARTRWTMGRSAGEYSVGIHVEGVKKLLKVAAKAIPAAAANLAFDDVPGEKRGKESARSKKLFALVTDIYGNPVPDAKVTFTTKSGTVTPTRAVSDSHGRTALLWRLGSKPGEQTLTGSVRGTDVTGEYVAQVGPREPTVRPASARSSDR
jgi:hypothetical protein